MTEKDIVQEAARKMGSGLSFYTSAISQTDNIELRSFFIQMRDQTEKSQDTLYRIAKELNYSIPTQQTFREGIRKDNSSLTGHGGNYRDRNSYLNTDSTHNYISSQSNGILNHIDTHTNHALQASPKSSSRTIRQ